MLQFDKPIALAALFQLAVLKKINVSIAVENKDVRHFNKNMETELIIHILPRMRQLHLNNPFANLWNTDRLHIFVLKNNS